MCVCVCVCVWLCAYILCWKIDLYWIWQNDRNMIAERMIPWMNLLEKSEPVSVVASTIWWWWWFVHACCKSDFRLRASISVVEKWKLVRFTTIITLCHHNFENPFCFSRSFTYWPFHTPNTTQNLQYKQFSADSLNGQYVFNQNKSC